MAKKLFLLILSLQISFTLFSQSKSIIDDSYFITGYVYDSSTTKGLSEVSVLVKSKYATTTDKNGFFKLRLPKKYISKGFKLMFARLTYRRMTLDISNQYFEATKNLIVHLFKSPGIKMEGVFIGHE